MSKEKLEDKITRLETEGKFDENVIPFNKKRVGEMNPKKFKYMPTHPLAKFVNLLIRIFLWFLGPIVNLIFFHLQIRGKKKLKCIRYRGAIVVANHVHFLDPLYLRQVAFSRNIYYLAARENNRKGLVGMVFRIAGVLPLSSDFQVAKKLDKAVGDVLKKQQILAIYAEQSLWLGYKKIRPLKPGAFHYAIKYDSPVVPVVTLFRHLSWWDKLIGRRFKLRLQICDPIFPDKTLRPKEAMNKLCEQCHESMVKCANEFYGTECDAAKLLQQKNT